MTLPLLPRAALAWSATGAGCIWSAHWLRPELTHLQRLESATFVEVLAALSAGALLACGGWFWLTLTATVASALRGLRAAPLPSPRWMRHLALTLCGLSVLAAPVGAHATPVAGEPPGAPDSPSLEGLPLPELPPTRTTPSERPSAGSRSTPVPPESVSPEQPTPPLPEPSRPEPSAPELTEPESTVPESATPEASPAPPSPPAHRGGRRTPSTVVVAPGDTLWRIAHDQLPAGATPQTIDRAWRQLWRDNRTVIGDEPDLIHPGQRLAIHEEDL